MQGTPQQPKLSVAIPVYDDPDEAAQMIQAVQESLSVPLELQFMIVDVGADRDTRIIDQHFTSSVLCLHASNLPEAKNKAACAASGDFVFFLFPGLFPRPGAIETLLNLLRDDRTVVAVAGRWCNAAGKLEVGYNVRRFPTFIALIFDILLLNKLLPRNRFTRRYKMRDFDHDARIRAEHANDCAFLVRREAITRYGGFNERYISGWFDQVEFCRSVHRAGEFILYEPHASFVSNSKVPLINRIVRDRYADYRHSECLYIRNHFGGLAGVVAQVATAVGMLQRIVFSMALPTGVRKLCLSALQTYVDDNYIRNLRQSYWTVFKRSLQWKP